MPSGLTMTWEPGQCLVKADKEKESIVSQATVHLIVPTFDSEVISFGFPLLTLESWPHGFELQLCFWADYFVQSYCVF